MTNFQRQKTVRALPSGHLAALERWSQVADEHAAIVTFLQWAHAEELLGTTAKSETMSWRSLVSRYFEVDEAELEFARRALRGEAP